MSEAAPLSGWRLSAWMAWRYLTGRKSQGIVNVVCVVSSVGVMVATAAMIVVLSVFNGLGGLVSSLFGSFDADLVIAPARGKTMRADSLYIEAVMALDGVMRCEPVVRDNVLARCGDRQAPAVLMGVGPQWRRMTQLDSIVVEGRLEKGRLAAGAILADRLAVSPGAMMPRIELFAPRREGKINLADPSRSFRQAAEGLSAVFLVEQEEYDAQMLLCPLPLARELLDYPAPLCSELVAQVAPGYNAARVAHDIEARLGATVRVRDRQQQHAAFFRMMSIEKLMGFALLLFITAVAACNIIGSLTMLIYEKRETLSTLRALGATEGFQRRLFWLEGCLISVVGAVAGALLGVALVVAQDVWGFVGFGGSEGDYIISAYPVQLLASDVAAVLLSVLLLGALVAWMPVRGIIKG